MIRIFRGSRDASGGRGIGWFTASALGSARGFSNARVIAVTGRDIPTDGSDAITIPTECIGDVDGDGEVGFPDAVTVLGQIGQKCKRLSG